MCGAGAVFEKKNYTSNDLLMVYFVCVIWDSDRRSVGILLPVFIIFIFAAFLSVV